MTGDAKFRAPIGGIAVDGHMIFQGLAGVVLIPSLSRKEHPGFSGEMALLTDLELLCIAQLAGIENICLARGRHDPG